MLFQNPADLIGRTPMIPLTRLLPETTTRILAKPESHNPGGSIKDRVAQAMLEQAEAGGRLASGATVIEPTSGNTGIALAMLCAIRGYRCVIVMPDSMSRERKLLMEAYGARVVLTPGNKGMSGAVEVAEALAHRTPGSFIPNQFQNPANPAVHYATTGPEIWAAAGGNVDIFVSGVGTGGTITGAGRFLQERNPNIRIVAVEPAASPLLSEGWAAPHGIQGIGPNFVPPILDTSLISEVLPVTDAQAAETAQFLAQREGLLTGISSGAAVYAALVLARRQETAEKTIAVMLPDTGRNYLTSGLFERA